MRIDFHQHVWTDELLAALRQRSRPPYLRGRRLVLPQGGEFDVDPDAYSPTRRLEALDRAELDAAIVSLPPTMEPTRDLVEAWNEGARSLIGLTSSRLLPLACGEILPGFCGAIVAAEELLDLSLTGPLLDHLQEKQQFLFVHPGPGSSSGVSWWAPGVTYTTQMQTAYAHWVAAGLSGWPRLRLRRGFDPQAPFTANIWFDTSSYGSRALEMTLQTFGASRLLFGSDAPVDRVTDGLDALRPFGPALTAQLTSSNPLALLNPVEQQWAA